MSDDEMPGDAPAESPPVLFYFDFSSPYAYLASHRIDAMCALYGRTVDWRPVLLGVVFKQSGGGPLLDQPLKSAYARRDMERCARFMGVPLTFPAPFPFASVAAARAVYWVKDQDEVLAHAVARGVFDATFADARDVESAEVVIEIAAGLGVDGDALRNALGAPAVKQRLRAEVETAIAAGVCGAPYFIADGEPFWGADRLDHLERWLATGGW